MQRNFLDKFLDKISNFPSWIKEIIYLNLQKDVNTDSELGYVFATFRPVLSDKGKCELNTKESGFDINIYNIFEYCDNGASISDITLNTYLSMEEVANYFIFAVDEGYIQIPDNSQILNIAGFLAGKFRTGEYFVQNGIISEQQLDDAILNYEHRTKKHNKKFGQSLVELGFISQNQLSILLSIKNEAKKRFILDHNEVPAISTTQDYETQIKKLKEENKQLKMRINELLLIGKKYE